MLYPSIFNENLFDDLMNLDFNFPSFPDFANMDRKLYGKHAGRVMKTDVREHEKEYEVDIDLPGFKKEEISLELDNGYLRVSASKGLEEDEKDKKGKLLRQERYTGAMQRSFYVGAGVKEEDIKAKFENGVLKLMVLKEDGKKLPEKKAIQIEG